MVTWTYLIADGRTSLPAAGLRDRPRRDVFFREGVPYQQQVQPSTASSPSRPEQESGKFPFQWVANRPEISLIYITGLVQREPRASGCIVEWASLDASPEAFEGGGTGLDSSAVAF